MPSLMARQARLALAPLVWLASIGCSTRVVDLALPDATAPGGATDVGPDADPNNVSCEAVRRDDGSVCKLCLGADGTIVNGACSPPPAPPAPPSDAGTAVVPMCKVIPRGDTRCRSCTAGTRAYTACLVCQPPFDLRGESCRSCNWDDLPNQRCLQCTAPDGTVTHDDCDAFRKEVVVPGGV